MSISSFLGNVSGLEKAVERAASSYQSAANGITSERMVSSEVAAISKQIDNIIAECNTVIQSHTTARTIIEAHGEKTAGSKAATETRIRRNDKEISDFIAEIKRLVPPIEIFNDRCNTREQNRQELNQLFGEIQERKSSRQNWIPFWSLAYVSKTNDIANDYNSRVRDWNALNDWINKNEDAHRDNVLRLQVLEYHCGELAKENDTLKKEFGRIAKLLTTLSILIDELQNFLIEIKTTKNDLMFMFAKSAEEAQALINSALSNISQCNSTFQKNLTDCSTDLSVEVMQEVKLLLA